MTGLQPGLDTGIISTLKLPPKSAWRLVLKLPPSGQPKLKGGGLVLGAKLGYAIIFVAGKHVAPPLYGPHP